MPLNDQIASLVANTGQLINTVNITKQEIDNSNLNISEHISNEDAHPSYVKKVQNLESLYCQLSNDGYVTNRFTDDGRIANECSIHEVVLEKFKLQSESNYTNAFVRSQNFLFDNYGGGKIKIPHGSILADNIALRQNILISGSSWWMNELKQSPGINSNFITLYDNNSANNGLMDLSVHGNRVLNTSGNAIHLDRTSAAGSGDIYDSKTTLHRIRVFYAAGNGIYLGRNIREIEAYRVFVENCGLNGFEIDTFCTDSFFTLCTSSHNFGAGFINRGSNNRFSQIKAFYCGNTNPRTIAFDWANPNGHGFVQSGGRMNIVACSEIQDCAGNGLHIENTSGNDFVGISIDSVGYSGSGHAINVSGSVSRTEIKGHILKRNSTVPTKGGSYSMGAVNIVSGSVSIDVSSSATDSDLTVSSSNPNSKVIINKRLVNGLPDVIVGNSNYSIETSMLRPNGTISKVAGYNFSGNDRYLIGCFNSSGSYIGDSFQARGDGSTVVGISGYNLSFYGSTPVPKATTSLLAPAPVINSGTNINTATTFEGYTIAQIVTALKNLGLIT